MHLPFTAVQFFAVFASYDIWVGPLPVFAHIAAITSLVFLLKPERYSNRFTALALSAMWAVTGVGYQMIAFASINPIARIFGLAFVAQAVFFAYEAFRGRLRFRFDVTDIRSYLGAAMIAFAMVVYPLLGYLAGHGYPFGPVFGVTPCPLVIYTFGMLMLTERSLPKYLLVLPMAWALIGSTAALSLGVHEDLGLLVAGLTATIALALRKHEDAPAEQPARTPIAEPTPAR